MTIKVLIHRQIPKKEPAPETLRAYALAENGRKGENLLSPGFRDVERAKDHVRGRLTEAFAAGNLPLPTIEFIVEDYKVDNQRT